jgi:hypothetical protein
VLRPADAQVRLWRARSGAVADSPTATSRLTPIVTPLATDSRTGGIRRTMCEPNLSAKLLGGIQRTPPSGFRNQQVVGSSPTAGSKITDNLRTSACCSGLGDASSTRPTALVEGRQPASHTFPGLRERACSCSAMRHMRADGTRVDQAARYSVCVPPNRTLWRDLRAGEDALAFQARHEELQTGLAQQQFAARGNPAGATGRTAQVNGDRGAQGGHADKGKQAARSASAKRRTAKVEITSGTTVAGHNCVRFYTR